MGKPMKVYIVEDSQILQRLLVSSITAAGAEVTGCSGNADEAIADLFALHPDLVVIDISLRSGSGFDVLKALQDHNLAPDAIKLVLTNHATAEYREICTLLGADRFYDKSMETAQALAFISTVAADGGRTASALHSSRAAARV